jgi:hypothetical protein
LLFELYGFRTSSGSLAKLTAMRRALLRVIVRRGADSGCCAGPILCFYLISDASFLPWHLRHQKGIAIPVGLIRQREPRLSHIEQR